MCSLIGQDLIWDQCITLLDAPCHIFITGSAGCGKTTLVRDLMQYYAKNKSIPQSQQWGIETTEDCLLLGPEQDRGIQTIRGQVSLFIRQKGIGNNIHRWVIIDDVDTFPQISQQALRRPMESYAHITRFLFIGSSQEDLIPALRSRCIHLQMDAVNVMQNKEKFCNFVKMPYYDYLTDDMWYWILNVAGTNISEIIRLLKLIASISTHYNSPPTMSVIRSLCSTPFSVDFMPLLSSLSERNLETGTHALLTIWKKGYAFEDILECFQTINSIYGSSNVKNNVIVHIFLVNAWISYCKGNTSVLALQNVLYKTLMHSADILPLYPNS
jgi:DNA polymerase III delta prime subunit